MISPKTDREQLIAETAYLQGYQDGFTEGTKDVYNLAQRLKNRHIETLKLIEAKEDGK